MNRNLVVVDIQYMFSGYFDQEYLEKVRSFVENNTWDNIVVIYNEKEHNDEDEKLEYIPLWLSNVATHVVSKWINGCLYDNYVNDLIKQGFKEEKSNKAWRKDEDLLIRTPTVHELFFIPKGLQEISNSINECTLIGGAEKYCLEDIKESLEYLGVKVNIDRRFTYKLDEWEGEM